MMTDDDIYDSLKKWRSFHLEEIPSLLFHPDPANGCHPPVWGRGSGSCGMRRRSVPP